MKQHCIEPGIARGRAPRRARSRIGWLMLAVVWGTSDAAPDEGPPVLPVAGLYDITAQVVMPHLDEMRRIRTQERRCVQAGALTDLFPVLRQPALRGCRFDYPAANGDGTDYVLVCASARVATGTVHLIHAPDALNGTLAIKMGGKNMTFSQHVEATRAGKCPDTATAPCDDETGSCGGG
jgi:hypothetical protein